MFEAILAICIGAASGTVPEGPACRDVLLPGYEAPTRAGCEAALAARAEPSATSATPPATQSAEPPITPPLASPEAPSVQPSASPPVTSPITPPATPPLDPLAASSATSHVASPEAPSATPSARCAPSGAVLPFAEVAPGVFVHEGRVAEPDGENGGDVSNIAFVVGTRSVAVIDSGGAAWVGEATWRAIRARTDLPVSHLILTHLHPDHVFGAGVFAGAGAQVVGHAGLGRALADRRQNYIDSFARLVGPARFIGSELPRVDAGVAQAETIDLGERVLVLTAWPQAHTATDLTVYDAASGILFAGDLLFDRHVPALDGSLRGWQAVLAELAAGPATRVVPGHGAALLDWPEAAAPLRRYLDTLAADTRAAIDDGQRMGEAVTTIAAGEADNWELFDAFNARNATVAFGELEWE